MAVSSPLAVRENETKLNSTGVPSEDVTQFPLCTPELNRCVQISHVELPSSRVISRNDFHVPSKSAAVNVVKVCLTSETNSKAVGFPSASRMVAVPQVWSLEAAMTPVRASEPPFESVCVPVKTPPVLIVNDPPLILISLLASQRPPRAFVLKLPPGVPSAAKLINPFAQPPVW